MLSSTASTSPMLRVVTSNSLSDLPPSAYCEELAPSRLMVTLQRSSDGSSQYSGHASCWSRKSVWKEGLPNISPMEHDGEDLPSLGGTHAVLALGAEALAAILKLDADLRHVKWKHTRDPERESQSGGHGRGRVCKASRGASGAGRGLRVCTPPPTLLACARAAEGQGRCSLDAARDARGGWAHLARSESEGEAELKDGRGARHDVGGERALKRCLRFQGRLPAAARLGRASRAVRVALRHRLSSAEWREEAGVAARANTLRASVQLEPKFVDYVF
ncbi:hypothetical protein T492DRAFT_1124185 [Pavlovales sp. CCMP2436]|nr:hypothetical protein T492DRAFT_1124185 [Pavlovales sp. CCMP2436]